MARLLLSILFLNPHAVSGFSVARPVMVRPASSSVFRAGHCTVGNAAPRIAAAPIMSLSAVAPALFALDLLAVTLKIAWRLAVAASVSIALRPTVVSILESKSPELLAKIRQRIDSEKKVLTKMLRPKLAAAEEAKAVEEANALAAAKAKADQEAMAKTAAEAAEAEAAAEKAAEEAAVARKALEAEAAKAAEAEALVRETEERERAAKIAEQQRLARERNEREKAEREKAEAERVAKVKAVAEKKAAEKAAAEKAAAEAATKLAVVGAASAETEAALETILTEIADGIEVDRILTLADAGEGREAALLESVNQLEAQAGALDAEVMREGLLGFWKVLVTSSVQIAANGLTGYGAPEDKGVLAHFQCFSKVEEGSLMPAMQTVEVISDALTDSASSVTLKGDFEVAAQGDKLGLVEDYNVLESGGMKQFDANPVPQRSTCTYLSPTLRVSRVDDGTLWVYQKVTAEDVTDEIFRLMSITGYEEEEDDERDWSEGGYDS